VRLNDSSVSFDPKESGQSGETLKVDVTVNVLR
jgi:hypothetical protein